MNRFRFFFPLLLVFLYLLPISIQAQTQVPTPDPASTDASIPQLHIVQEGETLTVIAEMYAVTVEELLAVNNLANADVLAVGQSLVIPGGEGAAVAATYTVEVGDTLAQIAAVFNTTPLEVLQTNRIVNTHYTPVAGQTLSIVSRTGSTLPQPVTGTPHLVVPGESLLTVAALYNLSPTALAAANGLSFPAYLYPGQRLRIPGEQGYHFLPGEWIDVAVRPLPIEQGSTVSIYVENLLDGRPSGQFASQPLRFEPHQEGHVALVGLDAFTAPGLHALRLEGSGSQPWRTFYQDLRVESSNFVTQPITVTQELSGLLDPQLRQDEDAFLAPIFNQYTETKQWQGLFQMPLAESFVSAGYGGGRSYNGGPVEIFHTGVDFAGAVGTPIFAPANGTVVFSDLLELRGLTVIVNHGWGVMTAYFHLSELFVAVGDEVMTGQTIASLGSTGLSTGPHLHWDLRIMNAPVNPLVWTEQEFP